MSAPLCTVTPLEALRRLYDVARKVDAKESGEFETLLQGELLVAEAALRVAAAPVVPVAAQPVVQVAKGEFNHYGLSSEQLNGLLNAGLKPDEISGADDVQHDRVHELVWWFFRLTQGQANAKWAIRHACELAYFIANNCVNRNIDLEAIRKSAFKEGVNISPAERGMLERIGFAAPQPAASVTDVAKDAARFAWLIGNVVSGSIGFGDWWINADEPAEEWRAAIDAAIAAQQGEKT